MQATVSSHIENVVHSAAGPATSTVSMSVDSKQEQKNSAFGRHHVSKSGGLKQSRAQPATVQTQPQNPRRQQAVDAELQISADNRQSHWKWRCNDDSCAALCVGQSHKLAPSVSKMRSGCGSTGTRPMREGGHTMWLTRPSSNPRCTCRSSNTQSDTTNFEAPK